MSTISRPVTVEGASFQLSYGRDASGQLAAILTPTSSRSTDLHFTVLGKNIDMAQAVVTLTFSSNQKSVLVDPGYVGTVDVDSQRLVAHHLTDDVTAQLPVAAINPPTKPSDAPLAVAPVTAPAVVEQALVAPVTPSEPATLSSMTAPPTLASQITPMLAPLPASAQAAPATRYHSVVDDETPAASTVAVNSEPAGPVKLFWSEPVTPPNGPAPVVGIEEMKLVEVHGEVAVVTPSGETVTGTDGLVVASGSTVRTLDNSSAALFMSGINSARLMPQCELVVTQTLQDSVRKTLLDLHRGAVFSRVGQRDGETQDYQVHTPEGSATADSTEMLSYRGSLEDLQGTTSTTRAGLVFDKRHLLAWNPPLDARGLMSDSASSFLGQTFIHHNDDSVNTFFYFPSDNRKPNADQIRHLVFSSGHQGTGQNKPNLGPDQVLQSILVDLQPFNTKLHDLLGRVNGGTASSGDLNFYHGLITVFFEKQIPGLAADFQNNQRLYLRLVDKASRVLHQDLQPFGTNCLTPQ